jgi:spore coat polysaccharide biosynthesis protein SpsF
MIEPRPTALIRCDASGRIGYGHIVRCVALAEQIQRDWKWRTIFAIAEDADGIRFAIQRGLTVEALPENIDLEGEGLWLLMLVEKYKASALVLDVRSELSRESVNVIRETGTLIVSIDDISQRRLEADFAFYPPIPQVGKMNWENFDGQLNSGWQWILMPMQFAEQAIKTNAHHIERPSILITMGGSDPEGLTLKVLAAIDSMNEKFTTRIVIGAAFMHNDELLKLLSTAQRSYEIIRSPLSMASVMAEADLAISSFGATAYELACMGVPAIYLCLSADHACSATVLDQAGVADNLGEHFNLSAVDIRAALQRWLTHDNLRLQASDRGRRLVDGQGVVRIAKVINDAWRKRQHNFSN